MVRPVICRRHLLHISFLFILAGASASAILYATTLQHAVSGLQNSLELAAADSTNSTKIAANRILSAVALALVSPTSSASSTSGSVRPTIASSVAASSTAVASTSSPTSTAAPFFKLGTCSVAGSYLSGKALMLSSAHSDDLNAVPLEYRLRDRRRTLYNPTMLPLPNNEYLVVAREGKTSHDAVWCILRWRWSATGQPILMCRNSVRALEKPRFRSRYAACARHPVLALDQGYLDPRIFFSPYGEPLILYGTNAVDICLGMYMIDLRVLIPELGKLMRIEHVPIRYDTYVELDRPPPVDEIQKNFFVMYDLDGAEYVHQQLTPRALSSMADPRKNLARDQAACYRKAFGDEVQRLHQATNSLRLTLCEFPCVPTAQNTVLISIVHIKHSIHGKLNYDRFVQVMNATAPFDIIGWSKKLVYAGHRETLLYTVSMAWDTRKRGDWVAPAIPPNKLVANTAQTPIKPVAAGKPKPDVTADKRKPDKEDTTADTKAGKQKPDIAADTTAGKEKPIIADTTADTKAGKQKPDIAADTTAGKEKPIIADTTADRKAGKQKPDIAADTTAGKEKPDTSDKHQLHRRAPAVRTVQKATIRAGARWPYVSSSSLANAANEKLKHMPLEFPGDKIVSKYYHGWLDDVIVLSFGVNDYTSHALHVRARDLVECILLC